MSSKPNVLAKFIKGKLIDVIPGVSATLNWIVSCWDKFSVGDGLKFEDGSVSDGRPNLKLNLEEGDNVKIEKGKNGAIKVSSTGGGVTVVGTDGSSAECTGELRFESEGDSNVKVSVGSPDSEGNVSVKVGVYWK